MCVLCCADQDRIVSPGTDSGFVGSESSRLTPAAAPSPLHQRATERWECPTLILFSAPPRYSLVQFLILLCVSVSQCSRASGQEPRELWERSCPVTIYWPVKIQQPQNRREQRGLPTQPWPRKEQQTGAEDALRLPLSTALGQFGEPERGRQRHQRVWAAEWQQWVSIFPSISCFTSNLDSCFRQNMFIFTQWKVIISCLSAAHTVSEVEQNDPNTVSLTSRHNSCSSCAPPSPPLPNYDTTR